MPIMMDCPTCHSPRGFTGNGLPAGWLICLNCSASLRLVDGRWGFSEIGPFEQAKRELEHLKAEFLRCLTPTGKLKTSRVGKLQFQRFVARVQGVIRMGNGSSIAVGFVDEADKIRGTEP